MTLREKEREKFFTSIEAIEDAHIPLHWGESFSCRASLPPHVLYLFDHRVPWTFLSLCRETHWSVKARAAGVHRSIRVCYHSFLFSNLKNTLAIIYGPRRKLLSNSCFGFGCPLERERERESLSQTVWIVSLIPRKFLFNDFSLSLLTAPLDFDGRREFASGFSAALLSFLPLAS